MENPKLNSKITFWKKEFGFKSAGEPNWKIGKYIEMDNVKLFVSSGENRVICSDVDKWEYILDDDISKKYNQTYFNGLLMEDVID